MKKTFYRWRNAVRYNICCTDEADKVYRWVSLSKSAYNVSLRIDLPVVHKGNDVALSERIAAGLLAGAGMGIKSNRRRNRAVRF